MSYKFQQIQPQKARGTLKESMWDDHDWIAEEKYDGDRRIAQFCGSSVRFTGTRESVDGSGFVEKTLNLPHLNGDMTTREVKAAMKRLTGTVLDGEMTIPAGTETRGGKSKYVTAIMGSLPAVAKQKQILGGYLQYVVFDCLWYKGRDIRGLSLRDRKNYLLQAHKEWGNSYVALAGQAVGTGKRRLLDAVLERGGEGVVLKRIDHTYGDSKLWVKVKGEWTADVVIMDYMNGKGKYADGIGALVFGQVVPNTKELTLVRLGTCSGFSDFMRTDMSLNWNKFKGRVIEIKHYGREPTGAFRHPQFKRFRDDKDPKDCIYREDEI